MTNNITKMSPNSVKGCFTLNFISVDIKQPEYDPRLPQSPALGDTKSQRREKLRIINFYIKFRGREGVQATAKLAGVIKGKLYNSVISSTWSPSTVGRAERCETVSMMCSFYLLCVVVSTCELHT